MFPLVSRHGVEQGSTVETEISYVWQKSLIINGFCDCCIRILRSSDTFDNIEHRNSATLLLSKSLWQYTSIKWPFLFHELIIACHKSDLFFSGSGGLIIACHKSDLFFFRIGRQTYDPFICSQSLY